MNWSCWFGHKDRVLSYENYKYDGEDIEPWSFRLRYICVRCKRLKITSFVYSGEMTTEQFYEIWEETNVDS